MLRPPTENSGSTAGFTLIELIIVVAIIAILAVVAVPQFTKYMRSAKAAEVVQMLDLIKKGAATYYAVPRVGSGTGVKVPCQFPAPVALTPAGASCCVDDNDGDHDERCDSVKSPWDHTTWAALHFAITDQHYFQYSFDSSGQLSEAIFTASGHADLDCDGLRSTFEMVIGGDPEATETECDSVVASGIFRDNETE